MQTNLRAAATVRASARATLAARLKLVKVLEMPEQDFADLVRRIEADPLFGKLLKHPVIRRRRYPKTRLALPFHDGPEAVTADHTGPDVTAALSRHRGALDLIRRIGSENFERYFLYQEGGVDIEGAAAACGLTAAEARSLVDFLLTFEIQSEFTTPAGFDPARRRRVACLGKIEADDNNAFNIAFFEPRLARGRYDIDYDLWRRLRESGKLARVEVRGASRLLRELELCNMRSDTLNRVIGEALLTQRAFIASGRAELKRVLSLREAARRLNLSSSTLCRMVWDRSVVLPDGREILLRGLFPQKKYVIEDLLKAHEGPWSRFSDRQVQDELKTRFQLRVPRRTVNYWRRRVAAVAP